MYDMILTAELTFPDFLSPEAVDLLSKVYIHIVLLCAILPHMTCLSLCLEAVDS